MAAKRHALQTSGRGAHKRRWRSKHCHVFWIYREGGMQGLFEETHTAHITHTQHRRVVAGAHSAGLFAMVLKKSHSSRAEFTSAPLLPYHTG